MATCCLFSPQPTKRPRLSLGFLKIYCIYSIKQVVSTAFVANPDLRVLDARIGLFSR